jgi:GH15 family glucan-1,4-alpha-glucosidase
VAGRIEDYAIVGDMQSVALICVDGSVDWLCLPRFDSEACFAVILGGHAEEHRRGSRICWDERRSVPG